MKWIAPALAVGGIAALAYWLSRPRTAPAGQTIYNALTPVGTLKSTVAPTESLVPVTSMPTMQTPVAPTMTYPKRMMETHGLPQRPASRNFNEFFMQAGLRCAVWEQMPYRKKLDYVIAYFRVSAFQANTLIPQIDGYCRDLAR